MDATTAGKDVVLFDGVCGLCDRFVRLLFRADRRGRLLYAPLQGPAATGVRRRHPAAAGADSILFVEGFGGPGERVSVKSDAALRILAGLGGPWGLAAALRLLPRGVRDLAYDFVAARRYRWFGKHDACRLPSSAERARFLE